MLGTDYLGRDTFSRIIWGARTTIGISVIATILAYFHWYYAGYRGSREGRLDGYDTEPRQ